MEETSNDNESFDSAMI
jgi:hypothetical protein